MSSPQHQTNLARQIAQIAHEGQQDKAGQAYITHPARVAAAVADATGDRFHPAVAVAWLHDVLEDRSDAYSWEGLLNMGVSAEIAEAVVTLTKRRGQPNAEYYAQVRTNPLAALVKWYDVRDNANPVRLAMLDEETRDRLTEKYARAREALRPSMPKRCGAMCGHPATYAVEVVPSAVEPLTACSAHVGDVLGNAAKARLRVPGAEVRLTVTALVPAEPEV